MKDFSFIILVGGKGERVKKITNGLSKSEIILNKKSRIIDYQLNQISKLKKNIIFLSNVKFKKLKENILVLIKNLEIATFMYQSIHYFFSASRSLISTPLSFFFSSEIKRAKRLVASRKGRAFFFAF